MVERMTFVTFRFSSRESVRQKKRELRYATVHAGGSSLIGFLYGPPNNFPISGILMIYCDRSHRVLPNQ